VSLKLLVRYYSSEKEQEQPGLKPVRVLVILKAKSLANLQKLVRLKALAGLRIGRPECLKHLSASVEKAKSSGQVS
jgi:hypothetical protein